MNNTQMLRLAWAKGGRNDFGASFSYEGTLSFSVHLPDSVLGKPYSVRLSYSCVCPFGAGQQPLKSWKIEYGAAAKIRKNSYAFLIPWAGGVVYNFEWHDPRLKNRKPDKGPGTLAQIVAAAMLGMLQSRTAQQFTKSESGDDIDPWHEACTAMHSLLEKTYPGLANAINSGRPRSEIAHAFAADIIRLTGVNYSEFPDRPDKMFSLARQRYKKRPRGSSARINLHLALRRNWSRYYDLNGAELVRLVNESLGTALTEGAILKRIRSDLKLTRDCKRGPKG